MCLTPLQMLIANRVINLQRESADVVIMSYESNSKYDYYIELIKRNKYVRQVNVIQLGNLSCMSRVKTLREIQKFAKDSSHYRKIYLASIDNFYMQYLLSRLKFQSIFTFDDGTANIFKNSSYFNNVATFRSRIARVFLGVRYNTFRIKTLSELHYSIYRGYDNIIPKVCFVDLYALNNQSNAYLSKGTKYIFLGQPINNSSDLTIEVFQRINRSGYSHLLYYSHPRESLLGLEQKIGSDNLLYSNLVIEDFVSKQLEEGYSIEIFTIVSSAVFSLISWKGVKVHLVKVEVVKEYFDTMSSLLQGHSFSILDLSLCQ